MNRVRLLLFWLIFSVGTVFAVLGALPVAVLRDRRRLGAYTVGWARFHGWCAATFLNIRARVEGEVPRAGEQVLIAAKHQAMFETFDLIRICGPVAIVAKQELVRIPLWGRIAERYGVIPIDRAGAAPALRNLLRAVEQVRKEGRSVLIFPEGTRIAPGERPELRPGFAGIYRGLGLPVVPVALDSGRLWPRDGVNKRPGWITIRFGEPIPPGLPRAEAEARVHAAINALESEAAA